MSAKLLLHEEVSVAEAILRVLEEAGIDMVFGIPGDQSGLAEGISAIELTAAGYAQPRNDFGRHGYRGPCPPSGPPHTYRFFLYALDAAPDLPPKASRADVLEFSDEHALGRAELSGTYGR